jgi:molybdopterin synthase sulfur carrier subunit
MPTVHFTENLKRHISCPTQTVCGNCVREVLDAIFVANPKLKHYVLDDQDRLRQHMLIAVDGVIIRDRVALSDGVNENSEVYVMQALSGG